MKILVTLSLLIGFAWPGLSKTFDRHACGVRFEMPPKWLITIEKGRADRICEISIRPRNWKKLIRDNNGVDLYGASVEVFEAPIELVRERDSTFEKRDGQWKILGRQGIVSEAAEIEGRGWKGLRGTSESGCHHEESGYAGLCPVEVALISDGRRTAMIIGAPRSLAEVDRILAKFQFK